MKISSNTFFSASEALNAFSEYVRELSPMHFERFWGYVKSTPDLDLALLRDDDDKLLAAFRDFISESEMLVEEVGERMRSWVALKQVQWCDDADDDLISWQRMELLDRLEHEPSPEWQY